MSQLYNIYCDESCHLENDHQPIMALGAVLCPHSEASRLATEIRKFKARYRATGELKWVKVSNSRLEFYLKLMNWFFKEKSIRFRALVVQNKEHLDHEAFNQGSHDTFYYKMYFSLLNKMLDPESQYNIYLDVKDTRSRRKLQKLHEVLCNNVHDFTSHMINHIQNIHSYESDLMQLADLILGAVSYRNRSLSGNKAKEKIIKFIENNINRSLKYSTSLREEKFNLFIFTPRAS